MNGMEVEMLSNGAYFKTRYLLNGTRLFMVMAGGDAPEKLNAAEVGKFFNSFTAFALPKKAPAPWVDFGVEHKAFNVQVPGIPNRNKSYEAREVGTNGTFKAYDFSDPVNGNYYLMQVRDLNAGFYMNGDSSYFASFKTTMEANADQTTLDSVTVFNGFPAYYFNGRKDAQKL